MLELSISSTASVACVMDPAHEKPTPVKRTPDKLSTGNRAADNTDRYMAALKDMLKHAGTVVDAWG